MPQSTPLDARFLVLEQLGLALESLIDDKDLLADASARNPWFTPAFTADALSAWTRVLTKQSLAAWKTHWPKTDTSPKIVGLVGAGNLPLVALHDLLCIYLAGHRLRFKPSSDDPILTPARRYVPLESLWMGKA